VLLVDQAGAEALVLLVALGIRHQQLLAKVMLEALVEVLLLVVVAAVLHKTALQTALILAALEEMEQHQALQELQLHTLEVAERMGTLLEGLAVPAAEEQEPLAQQQALIETQHQILAEAVVAE
jgi:hypothetical protein